MQQIASLKLNVFEHSVNRNICLVKTQILKIITKKSDCIGMLVPFSYYRTYSRNRIRVSVRKKTLFWNFPQKRQKRCKINHKIIIPQSGHLIRIKTNGLYNVQRCAKVKITGNYSGNYLIWKFEKLRILESFENWKQNENLLKISKSKFRKFVWLFLENLVIKKLVS